MLLNDLYTVLETKFPNEHGLEVTVEINKNHAIFEGHFPNFPVTPGVAILQILKNTLQLHLQHSLFLQSASSIKFLNMVNPNEQTVLIFTINYSIENELIKVKNSTSFKDGSSVLKCNATFVKK